MNREIKFRVWDKERKEFIEWLNADPMIQCASGALLCWERTQNKDGSYGEDIIVNKPEFSINLVIQQYTGLKDKDGKEIYEGDIMIYENKYQIVDFRYGGWYIHYEAPNKSESSFLETVFDRKIIGNIFENPDLIK